MCSLFGVCVRHVGVFIIVCCVGSLVVCWARVGILGWLFVLEVRDCFVRWVFVDSCLVVDCLKVVEL